MSFIDDKIKILEMICAELLPWETCEDDQHVFLDEDDFAKEGFTFNGALLILKDIFSVESVNKMDVLATGGKKEVHLTVVSLLEEYLKNLKYPETQFFGEADYLNGAVSAPSKIFIVVDEKKGIYKKDKPENCYKIKIPSKRFSVIKYLTQKDKVSVSELGKETGQEPTLILKEIKNINSAFRKELSVAYDLITHADTRGYSLNRDKFDINL